MKGVFPLLIVVIFDQFFKGAKIEIHLRKTAKTAAATTTIRGVVIKLGFFCSKKNLDEAIERNMWDGSLTRLSFAIEKRSLY